ncbi:beta-ketoacyl synthase N-terminal-like domain-containing protein [Actinoplanes sp. NPDC051861]|uniref:beta-ketoacyl synthase N-terminal-like domain-containing protein n=1 Tax=Actinoplanes sp. NPDC051861 TaxID=3155170 RepID=UPI00342673C0
MSALIAASVISTCLGDGPQTFAALLRGESGAGLLRHSGPERLGVHAGYHIGGDDPDRPFRAGELLAGCLRAAVRESGLDPRTARAVVLVGTGLRELSAVEHWATGGPVFPDRRLHFGDVVRQVLPAARDVVTISNACSAGGHALALAQDMVELGEADVVIACGTDTMTRSMLAMIGRVAPVPTTRVRPFDQDRQGVLLGEAAAAVVVVPEDWTGPVRGRVAATGLSCDAHHETAPDIEGIGRAIRNAYERAGHTVSDVDLVVAHGTGTALNDPAESEALRKAVAGAGPGPLITAVKGAVGHTSGSAALVNVDVALRCLDTGAVPPVVGLRTVLPEGHGLRFVRDRPVRTPVRLAQVNSFGFGGVNAVTLLEAA